MTWFYVHCLLAIVIIVKDHNGTLETSVNRFEQRIGIYTPPDSTIENNDPMVLFEEESNRLRDKP